MSLMQSRQPKSYRWQKGDLISATEACLLLGYKSGRNLQDKKRRQAVVERFAEADCTLTVGIIVGGEQRFLRSEIDDYLTAVVEAVQYPKGKGKLSLVA